MHHHLKSALLTAVIWTLALPYVFAQPQKGTSPKKGPEIGAPVQKGLTKELRCNVDYLQTSIVHNLDAAGLDRAREVLVKTGKFTEAEFSAMAARANISNFPPGLNSVQKLGVSATFHAKGYVQGTFLLPFNGIAEFTSLVWVPLADNPDLQPQFNDGKDLFFFTVLWDTHFPTGEQPALQWMPKPFVATMKAKHSKARPEFVGEDMLFYFRGETFYQPLRDIGYTEAEAGRIMQLATDAYKPAGFSYRQQKALLPAIKALKAYAIADFNPGFGTARLYWVPTEENGTAPDSLRPRSAEGAFIVSMLSRSSASDPKISNAHYANKPEWEYNATVHNYYASGGTDAQLEEQALKRTSAEKQKSTGGSGTSGTTSSGVQYNTGVDMSAFQKPFQGCMVYVNGSNGVVYVVPVNGKPVTSPGSIANAAFRFSVPGGSYSQYEWIAGTDARTILKQLKAKNMTAVQQRTYTAE